MSAAEMSAYERHAYQEIQTRLAEARARRDGRLRRLSGRVSGALLDNPAGRVIARATEGICALLADGAAYSVRRQAIYEAFRKKGAGQVRGPSDVLALDLEQVDQVVGALGVKYRLLAAAEGAVTGAGGLVGMGADIPALVSCNLRASAEYATYYGFDVGAEPERRYALETLFLSSAPDDGAKQSALLELRKIAVAAAAGQGWKDLEKHLLVKGMRRVAEALGMRLTRAKLAQMIPIVGGTLGAGYNAWFTANHVRLASDLYRLRFLMRKHAGMPLLAQGAACCRQPRPSRGQACSGHPGCPAALPRDSIRLHPSSRSQNPSRERLCSRGLASGVYVW